MKRVIALTVSAVGVTALAGAGITYALFTASAGPAEQEFVAGTVEIRADRDFGDSVPGPMFYLDGATDGMATDGSDVGYYPTGLWAPGDAHHRVFQIENTGTLDAKITSFTAELQSGDAELAGALDVKIYDGIYMDSDGNVIDPTVPLLYEGKLADFFNTGVTLSPEVELAQWDMATFGILVSFPLNAGNEYQGDSIKVSFTAHAEQLANNP